MKKKNKKNRKCKKFKIIYILPIVIVIIMIIGIVFCCKNVNPVSNKSDKVMVEIEKGSTIRQITATLEEKKIIKNKYFADLYIKLNKIEGLQAGNYMLDRNSSLKEIFKILQSGSNVKDQTVTITFNEGKTMRGIAKIIDKNTSNSYDDVFKVLEDKEYINSLINEYWFLDNVILDKNIYYPLEGYLAPDTYEFKVNASVQDIFKKLLDQTNVVLTKYKSEIEKSNMSVHQILTLASMVESEGITLEDRKNIAGVFVNRLNKKMSLGSDVTTYYAFKIELGERDLYKSEINNPNPYNTRSSANAGKLPVGPICNPSSTSILATIEYSSNDYLYFVADKNMKVYFTKTDAEHNKIINELKSSGLWYEY